MTKKSTHTVFKVVALFLGVFVAFLIGESFARIYYFGSNGFSYKKVNSFDNLFASGFVKKTNIKGLNYELKANVNTLYKLKPFQTNTMGLRDKEYQLKKADSSYRIAVIGDSFTMGTGVSNEEMYHTIAEKKLNSLSKDKNFELINFGVGGYNLQEYTAVLKEKVLKYEPNELLIGFCAYNDHYIAGVDYSAVEFKVVEQRNLFWNSYLKTFIKTKIKSKKDVSGVQYTVDNLNYINQKLQEIAKLCLNNNIKISLIYLALNDKEKEVNQIKILTEENGMNFINAATVFKNTPLKEVILNELDPHPNNKANIIYADLLFNAFNKR